MKAISIVKDTQITPILECGTKVLYWDTEIKYFETVQLSYIKTTLGLKHQTQPLQCFGKQGNSLYCSGNRNTSVNSGPN